MRRLGMYLCYESVGSCLLTGVSGAQSGAPQPSLEKWLTRKGAVILDAKVTAVNTTTGVSRSVNTAPSGDYAIPSLPPGTYDIKVQAAGFALAEAKGTKLSVGDQQDLNFKLAIAGASDRRYLLGCALHVSRSKPHGSSSIGSAD
jgi:hypothetical protein